MSKLRISGDSSGYVDLEAPATAGTTTIALEQIPLKNAVNTFTSNTGIGVTPESSYAGRPTLRIGAGLAIGGYGSGNPSHHWINANAYQAASDATEKYIGADQASQIKQTNGAFTFNVAPNGNADAAISWTNAMTIDNAGKVGIGTASPTAKLHIEAPDNTDLIRFTVTGNEMWAFKGASATGSNDTVSFGIAGGTQAMAWDESGIVTKPYQPAAVAYTMPDSNNGTLVYSIEKFDNAGNMNLTNGRFTCPVAGVYSVSISGFYNNGRANNGDVAIRVNNSLYVRASYSNESTSNYVAITGVSLVKVAANDYITIFTEGDMHGSNATVFSVHLVG